MEDNWTTKPYWSSIADSENRSTEHMKQEQKLQVQCQWRLTKHHTLMNFPWWTLKIGTRTHETRAEVTDAMPLKDTRQTKPIWKRQILTNCQWQTLKTGQRTHEMAEIADAMLMKDNRAPKPTWMHQTQMNSPWHTLKIGQKNTRNRSRNYRCSANKG